MILFLHYITCLLTVLLPHNLHYLTCLRVTLFSHPWHYVICLHTVRLSQSWYYVIITFFTWFSFIRYSNDVSSIYLCIKLYTASYYFPLRRTSLSYLLPRHIYVSSPNISHTYTTSYVSSLSFSLKLDTMLCTAHTLYYVMSFSCLHLSTHTSASN